MHEINVYQNIEESPYVYKYNDYELYFSSPFYLKNYKTRIDNYIKEEFYKLKNRYSIFNDEFNKTLNDVLIISFYKKVEKRGFRIYKKGERIKNG